MAGSPIPDPESSAGGHLLPVRRTCSIAGAGVAALLAFALRVHRLDLQCLTGDEAFSVLAAQRWLAGSMDIYGPGSIESTPPLHYLLLSGWVAITGPTEFAARYLSVVVGVLTVATAYAFGVSLGSRRLGLTFGVLIAASPFLVLYSQTARAYGLLAWLSLATALAAVRLLSGPSTRLRRDALTYVVVTTLALYTHTFAALLLAFHVALFVVWPRSRVRWRIRLLVVALVAGLAAPWWLRALGLASSPAEMWLERGSIFDRLVLVIRVFVLGPVAADGVGLPASLAWLLVATALGLFVVGAVPGPRGWSVTSRVACSYFLGCVAAAVVISWQVPLLRDRFLIAAAPGLLLGMAAAGERVRVWKPALGGLVVALATGVTVSGLPSHYRTVAVATSGDMRALVRHVVDRRLADSAFVTNLPPTDPFYQYDDPLVPTYYVPDAQPADRAAGLPVLAGLGASHSDVWLSPFRYGSEGNRFVERYLAETGFGAEDLWFGHIRLQRFALGDAGNPVASGYDRAWRHPTGQILLRRAELSPNPVRAGTVLRVALEWGPDGPTVTPYTVFVHLMAGDGRLVAQRDSQPVGGHRPTTGWTAGDTVWDHLGLPIPAESAAGDYRLLVGWYDETGHRLAVDTSGDVLGLGLVRIETATR